MKRLEAGFAAGLEETTRAPHSLIHLLTDRRGQLAPPLHQPCLRAESTSSCFHKAHKTRIVIFAVRNRLREAK